MFGLRIHCDTPLPWLEPSGPAQSADVCIALDSGATAPFAGLAARPRYRSITLGRLGRPLFIVDDLQDGAYLRLRYDDGVEFVIDRLGTRVFGSWGAESTPEDAVVYLLALVSGLLLRLRGITCLHASAVVVNGRALAFVGASEAGKSTTAAAFARRGFKVLTDDIAALAASDQGFLVQPGVPRILLWPPSVAALWGRGDALPRVLSTWDKRYFDLPAHDAFHGCAAPLDAIYFLDDRGTGEAVGFAPLMGVAALLQLTANTYVNYLLDARQRARDFTMLSRLAANVPVLRVRRPDDLSRLPAVCEEIAEHFARNCSERVDSVLV